MYFVLASSGSVNPVSLSIREKACVLGNPNSLFPSLKDVVENNAADLSALSNAGAVSDEEALPLSAWQNLRMRLSGVYNRNHLRIREIVFDDFLRQGRSISRRRHGHSGHGSAFNKARRVLLCACDRERGSFVVCVNAVVASFLGDTGRIFGRVYRSASCRLGSRSSPFCSAFIASISRSAAPSCAALSGLFALRTFFACAFSFSGL